MLRIPMTEPEDNPQRQPTAAERLLADPGRRLVGNKVRFHHWAPGTGILCTKAHPGGGVELHGMPGVFAATLFEIDGETSAIPLEGKVD